MYLSLTHTFIFAQEDKENVLAKMEVSLTIDAHDHSPLMFSSNLARLSCFGKRYNIILDSRIAYKLVNLKQIAKKKKKKRLNKCGDGVQMIIG